MKPKGDNLEMFFKKFMFYFLSFGLILIPLFLNQIESDKVAAIAILHVIAIVATFIEIELVKKISEIENKGKLGKSFLLVFIRDIICLVLIFLAVQTLMSYIIIQFNYDIVGISYFFLFSLLFFIYSFVSSM